MSDDRKPSQDELERLFVNNADLDWLSAGLNRFNPIRTMGMQHMEIRHSAILGWLLDPQETHGLGDDFLRAFLSAAFHESGVEGEPTALTISQADLGDAEIRREWRHIDLLAISPSNKWVFVIENKFNSTQHGDQLRVYRERAGETFKKMKVRGVFLTLNEELPEDAQYATIGYDQVCELLSRFITGRSRPLAADVETFLKHYLRVLEEATDMSNEQKELEGLAKSLYRDHRKVIDFIVSHGTTTDFAIAIENVFGADFETKEEAEVKGREYWFGSLKGNQLSFLPSQWCENMNWETHHWDGCDDYWMGGPLAMWLELRSNNEGASGRLHLIAELGPLADLEARRSFVDEISGLARDDKKLKIKFRKDAAAEGRRYSRFFDRGSVNVNDVQDSENIAGAIVELLKKFEAEMTAVEKILPNLIQYSYVPKKRDVSE